MQSLSWSFGLEKELQGLLRETKKKQPQFRQRIEECIQNIQSVERLEESRVLEGIVLVLITALESKESKVVTCALSSLEFLLSHKAFDETYGEQLLNFFEKQLNSQIEGKNKLKSLRVLILFCSYCVKQKYPDCDYLFRGLSILLKCLENDLLQPEWKAAAEAGFRQTVAEAFEVVLDQDRETSFNELTPSMTSAYLLFQDLCSMVSKSNVSNRLSGYVLRRSLVYQILMDCIHSQAFIENQVFKQLLLEVFPPVLCMENSTAVKTDDFPNFLMLFVDYVQLYIKIFPKGCAESFEQFISFVVSDSVKEEKVNYILGALFDLFQVTDGQTPFLVSYISNLSGNGDEIQDEIEPKLNIFRELFSYLTRMVQKIPQNVFSANDPRVTAQNDMNKVLPIVLGTKYQRVFLILEVMERFMKSFSILKRDFSNNCFITRAIVQTNWPIIQEILLCYAKNHLSVLLDSCYSEAWTYTVDFMRNMQLEMELNQLLKNVCGILREELLPVKDQWSQYVAQVRRHVLSVLPLLMDMVKYFVSLENLNEENNCLNDFFSLVFLLDYLSSQENFKESCNLASDLNKFYGELLQISSPQRIVSRWFHEVYKLCSTYFESLPKKKPRMDQTFLQRLLWLQENLSFVESSLKKFLLLTTSEFVGNLISNPQVTEEVQIAGVNITVQIIHQMMTSIDVGFQDNSILLELFRPMIVFENIVVFDHVLQAVTDLLQSYLDILNSKDTWTTLLDMLYQVPMKEDYQLVIFRLITVLSRDAISYLPYTTECLQLWTKFLCRCIQSLKDLNLSLTCLGYIWNTVDAVSRHWGETTHILETGLNNEDLEMHYNKITCIMIEISVLTRDGRPEIRNSTLRMIIDAVKVAADRQFPSFWKNVCQTFLIPICEFLFEEANEEQTQSGHLDMNIRIHHSRNTLGKQWDESRIIYLEGIVKLFYQFWNSFIQHEEETTDSWSQIVQFVMYCVKSPRTELCKAGVDMLLSVFDCFCDQEATGQVVRTVTEKRSEAMFWERLWNIIQLPFPTDNKDDIKEANIPAYLTLIAGVKNLLTNSRYSFSPNQARQLFDIVISLVHSPIGLKNQELFMSSIEFFREASFDNESECWNVFFEELLELCKHSLEIGLESCEYSTRIRLSLQTVESAFQKSLVSLKARLAYLTVFVELLMPYIELYSFEDSSKSAMALDSLRALVVVVKSCVIREVSPKDLDMKLFDRIVELAETFIGIEKQESSMVDGYSRHLLSDHEIFWRKESYDIILIDLLASRLLIHQEFLTNTSWEKAIRLLRKGFQIESYEDKGRRLRFRHACRVSLLKWIQIQSRNELYLLPLSSTKRSVVEEAKLDILNNTLALTQELLEEKWNGGSYPLSSAICLEIQDVFQSLLNYETLSCLAQDAFNEVRLSREPKHNNDDVSSIPLLRKTLMSLREKLSICSTLELSNISELAVSLLKDMDHCVFVTDEKGDL